MKKPCLKISQIVHLKDPDLNAEDCIKKVNVITYYDEHEQCWVFVDEDEEDWFENEFEEYAEPQYSLPENWYCEKDKAVIDALLDLFEDTDLFDSINQYWESYSESNSYNCIGMRNGNFDIDSESLFKRINAEQLSSAEVLRLIAQMKNEEPIQPSKNVKKDITTHSSQSSTLKGFAAISAKNSSKKSLF